MLGFFKELNSLILSSEIIELESWKTLKAYFLSFVIKISAWPPEAKYSKSFEEELFAGRVK